MVIFSETKYSEPGTMTSVNTKEANRKWDLLIKALKANSKFLARKDKFILVIIACRKVVRNFEFPPGNCIIFSRERLMQLYGENLCYRPQFFAMAECQRMGYIPESTDED